MYKFREIKSEAELEHFMHLRYERYMKSSNKSFVKLNENKIDIDVYDLNSKHFGLFYKEAPVGGFRLINHKSEIYDEKAFNIGLKYGVFNEELHSRENLIKHDYPDFPFISNSEIPRSISSFYKSVTKQKNDILEGSRLVLIGKHNGLRLAKFLVECSIVYSIICSKKHYVLNCRSTHERFYKGYGFRTINDDDRSYLKEKTESAALLSLSSIGSKFHDSFHEMAYQFTNNNTISRAI